MRVEIRKWERKHIEIEFASVSFSHLSYWVILGMFWIITMNNGILLRIKIWGYLISPIHQAFIMHLLKYPSMIKLNNFQLTAGGLWYFKNTWCSYLILGQISRGYIILSPKIIKESKKYFSITFFRWYFRLL